MKSRANIAGHPLHPMLIVIPAGGVLITLVLDLVHLATRDPMWWSATRPVLAITVIAGLIAAVPGLIDLATVVPKGRATSLGVAHMGINVLVVLISLFNGWFRWDWPAGAEIHGSPGIGWSMLATGMLAVSGFLGWTLVQTHHVGVLEADEGGAPAEPARATRPTRTRGLEHPPTPAPG